MAKHKSFTFAPVVASATLQAVSLQLNGMLMMWKIQQAMQDDAIWTARIHPAFFPVTGLKCSYSPPSHEHIENFTKDLEITRDLENRASPVNQTHVKRS